MGKLTKQREIFCKYYKSTNNATESAIKAGYSKKTAYSIGSRLLKDVEVQKYLNKLMSGEEKKRMMNLQQIQEFWASVVNDKRAKLSDRLKASEYIAKSNAAFITKTEISGKVETKTENQISLLSTEDLKALVDGIKDSE